MKKMIALLLVLCLTAGVFAGCGSQASGGETKPSEEAKKISAEITAPVVQAASNPKYVFLFIGDGMSYPQIQSTSDFLVSATY